MSPHIDQVLDEPWPPRFDRTPAMLVEVYPQLQEMSGLTHDQLRDKVVHLASERDFQGALDAHSLLPCESLSITDREWQAYCLFHLGDHELVRD